MCLVANIRHSKYTNYNSNSYKYSKKEINEMILIRCILPTQLSSDLKSIISLEFIYAYHGAFWSFYKFQTDGRMVCYQRMKLIYHL